MSAIDDRTARHDEGCPILTKRTCECPAGVAQIEAAKLRMSRHRLLGIARLVAECARSGAHIQPGSFITTQAVQLLKELDAESENDALPGFVVTNDPSQMSAAALESGATSEYVRAPPPNSCNRHTDCAAAKANPVPGRIQCCHDDCCEDCFGS